MSVKKVWFVKLIIIEKLSGFIFFLLFRWEWEFNGSFIFMDFFFFLLRQLPLCFIEVLNMARFGIQWVIEAIILRWDACTY